ncbi:ATP-dependent Clp protease adaptor ClpS [Sphingobacterium chuzhouense]|uniref:ATP-dependent Clp protease adaptor ClpS n=1 Tax=Sphingobacterium chuzhouense TaxID=1742264 RepID=A0ABR7XNS0_9SPHI|nr:ATP-dependent Clp protease adaptor ClpS [Sphingobacterium chuzhouense]MBD1420154.1 ATP-dependent Clp protease adaptor ClpS [Sphingobacterium chuzhouense]
MGVETEQEAFTLEEILATVRSSNRLILWNDEINTFDHVIDCLMKHLQYSEGQAEQIAWKVHTEGKCAVLEGSLTEMEIYRKILKSEGLTVSVE